MSESQSRYSIVERLTKEKMRLMDEKSNVSKKVIDLLSDITYLEEELEERRSDYTERMKLQEDQISKQIANKNLEIQFLKDNQEGLTSNIDKKITVIDEALEKISAISRESTTSDTEK